MRNVLFLLTAALMAGRVQAQLTYLTDNRNVNASGYAVAIFSSLDGNGNTSIQWQTNSYSGWQMPASAYADFRGSISGGTNISSPNPLMSCFASSSASQDSSMTLSQIQINSSINVLTGGNGGKCLADSLSSFVVSFNVSSPVLASLAADWFYQTAGTYWVPGNGGCSLISANDGLIWQSTLLSVDPYDIYEGNRLDTFSTTLLPGDIYTLSLSMETASTYHDNPATYVNYGADVTLATYLIIPVPEPSAWLLSTLGLVGFAIRKRREGNRRRI